MKGKRKWSFYLNRISLMACWGFVVHFTTTTYGGEREITENSEQEEVSQKKAVVSKGIEKKRDYLPMRMGPEDWREREIGFFLNDSEEENTSLIRTYKINHWNDDEKKRLREGVSNFLASEGNTEILEKWKSISGKKFWNEGDEILKWLSDAGERGDKETWFCMGLIYSKGARIIKEKEVSAFECFSKSAEKGNAEAMVILSDCYENGFGVHKATEKAVEWCFKAIEAGSVEACEKLADYYERGLGVEQDEKAAVRYFMKGLENTNCMIMSSKRSFARKRGVSYAYLEKKAIGWYVKGAILKVKEAQRELAYCYDIGLGIGKNKREALRWYKEAADQGCTFSMLRVGYFYEKGWVVREDWETALKWYEKAKDNGEKKALEYIEKGKEMRKKKLIKERLEGEDFQYIA